MWKIPVIFVIFIHMSVGLLNFVTETQQQQKQQQLGKIIHTTTTLSHPRHGLVATSSGELVFFAGGNSSTGASDRVDIYNVTSGSWATTLSLFLVMNLQPLPHKILSSLLEVGMGISTTFLNQVDIYNTLNGSWFAANLTQPRNGLAATSVGNLVLFGGGWNSTYPSSVVDVFSVTSNTWTTATLSVGRFILAATPLKKYCILWRRTGWIKLFECD
jgi:hypothetical protein